MKERPILFSAPMVRAILEGRKTQTRRICKPIMAWEKQDCREARFWNGGWHEFFIGADIPYAKLMCRHGKRGDRLWVRETWENSIAAPDEVSYRATALKEGWLAEEVAEARWKPSIHMPRWASRIDLEITGIRVERLQDISEADAIAEGCGKSKGGMFCGGPHKAHGFPTQHNTAKEAYANLWGSINGKGSWAANPWVWIVCFKKVKP